MTDPDTRLRNDLETLIGFLPCRTPGPWIELACTSLDLLLQDHAALELRAAEQAQKLIRRYGSAGRGAAGLPAAFCSRLANRMSRLAREELRHFEQVIALIEKRGDEFTSVSASRYAAGLHELARRSGPGALLDALIIGAVIEARSCERFFCLVESDCGLDADVAAFYRSLLKSEARHFEVYLELAGMLEAGDLAARTEVFLRRDQELIESTDELLRFHSGVPAAACTRSR